jgi:calcineurin-like phosphoesterase
MVFLGDINGAAGKTALEKHLPALRERWKPDVVIANAENARNGSGLTPELYRTFRSWGIDAITLGDHVFRDPKIVPFLEKPEEPIARPANLSGRAPGKRWSRIPASGTRTRDIYVCTVHGRIFFPLPANDPFAAIRNAPSDTAAAGEAVKAFGAKGAKMAQLIREGKLSYDDLKASISEIGRAHV